jgi:GNAT superfamily N-acetyltransferase
MVNVRSGVEEDAPKVAHMLDGFNREFGEPSPGPEVLESRVRSFIARGTKDYVLVGDGPDGFAQLSFNESVWSEGPVCLIEELYVEPGLRRRGRGRALMEAIIELAADRGADGLEVITGEDDTGARLLYEAFGFRNEIEGEANSRSLFYERVL